MANVVKPTGSVSPTSSPGGAAGLRRNVLSMPEVLTQSVANAAPSAAVSVLPAIAFIYAGNGAWLTFVIATISMVLIGYRSEEHTSELQSRSDLVCRLLL